MHEHFLELMTLHGLGGLLSLTALEIILGIDNVVFIALVIQHLKKQQREKARKIGLTLALGMRVLLLLSIAWVLSLTQPFFTLLGRAFSGKDALLLVGGIFLIYKATTSFRDMFSTEDEKALRDSKGGLIVTIVQIIFIDLVFSFDSVITAVGVTKNIPIIIVAMTIAMLIMLFFTGFVSEFIFKNPTIKTLAVSFILLIGVLLIAESFGQHIPRAYIYSAMAFSAGVEGINILIRKKKDRLIKP